MSKLDISSTKVSKKQKRMVVKHIKGQSNVEIGRVEYPTAKPKSQRQIVHQQLNKPAVRQYMEQAKLVAMKEYDIGWHRIMKAVDKGLDATKTDHYSGAKMDDIPTQLRAAKQASDYLEMPKSAEEVKEQLKELASNSSEMEIVQAIFRK